MAAKPLAATPRSAAGGCGGAGRACSAPATATRRWGWRAAGGDALEAGRPVCVVRGRRRRLPGPRGDAGAVRRDAAEGDWRGQSRGHVTACPAALSGSRRLGSASPPSLAPARGPRDPPGRGGRPGVCRPESRPRARAGRAGTRSATATPGGGGRGGSWARVSRRRGWRGDGPW